MRTISLQELQELRTQYLMICSPAEIDSINQELGSFFYFIGRKLTPKLSVEFETEDAVIVFLNALGYSKRGGKNLHHALDFDKGSYKSFTPVCEDGKWYILEVPLPKDK